MAQATARFKVVAKEPIGGNNGQRKIVMVAKSGASENQTLHRDDQAVVQKIELLWDTSAEKPIFTVGSDVLVTFNGPA